MLNKQQINKNTDINCFKPVQVNDESIRAFLSWEKNNYSKICIFIAQSRKI